jgi:triacylglycerol esterase/lipase EstA (alpha/beta hydrolase family)
VNTHELRRWRPVHSQLGRTRAAGCLILALAGLLVLASACATPVGVREIGSQQAQRSLTTNVLTRDEPSAPSTQVLTRLALLERFADQPADALAELQAHLAPEGDEDRLFALAELSFLYADQGGPRSYYLAAAIYAYAYLFPEGAGTPPSPFDPRFRLACDLYNRGLAEGLGPGGGPRVDLTPGQLGFAMPFGLLEVTADPAAFLWAGYGLTDFVSAANLEVRGLRNRYRSPGIGAPLVAGLAPPEPGAPLPPGSQYIPQARKVAVTAFLRLEGARQGLVRGVVRGTLELYTLERALTVHVGPVTVPLEYETSSALAASLEGSPIWDFGMIGFLAGGARLLEGIATTDGLYMQPYRPGKIPVVLVHGTFSSPARWAELANELNNDPAIASAYTIWTFTYNSGNPIAYSAGLLREALTQAVKALDPEGKDPALHRMVVIGHSQGGLLAKLTVVDSGTRFWDNLSTKPLAALKVSAETRAILERSLFFTPLPFVKRVIFIATPHGGSKLAGARLARLISKIVKEPVEIVQGVGEVVARNQDAIALRSLSDIPSSVENMSPTNRFVLTLASIPVADGVPAHSIIAVRGDGPVEEGNDGVVTYDSAHIEGVASELVVRSDHSVQGNPATIREVRRILLEHLQGP